MTELSGYVLRDFDTFTNRYLIRVIDNIDFRFLTIDDLVSGEFCKIIEKNSDNITIANTSAIVYYMQKMLIEEQDVFFKEHTKAFDFEALRICVLDALTNIDNIKGTLSKKDIFRLNTIKKCKTEREFLTNCVIGFYPETEFFLYKNGRIESSFLGGFVDFVAENKIWDFLFNNPDRLFSWKELNIFDWCFKKNINIRYEGIETKATITWIDKIGDKYKIKYSPNFNPNITIISNDTYTKEKLISAVKDAR